MYCSLSVSFYVPLGFFICSSGPESNGCSLLTVWVGLSSHRVRTSEQNWIQGGFDMLWVILSSYPNSCCSDEMRVPNGLVVNCNVSVTHVGLDVLPSSDSSPWFTLNLRCYHFNPKNYFPPLYYILNSPSLLPIS